MSTDDGFHAEVWVYTGRRNGTKDALRHVFIGEDGEERWYAKGPAAPVIGARYTVEVSDDDKGAARIKTARLAGPSESPSLTEWRLEDRTAVAVLESAREANRAAKENQEIGDLTLREVRDRIRIAMPARGAGILAVVLKYLRG